MKKIWTFMNGTKQDLQERVEELNSLIKRNAFTFGKHNNEKGYLIEGSVSKAEINALFRDKEHPNFKPCGDQILRNFLNGLVIHLRGPKEDKKKSIVD